MSSSMLLRTSALLGSRMSGKSMMGAGPIRNKITVLVGGEESFDIAQACKEHDTLVLQEGIDRELFFRERHIKPNKWRNMDAGFTRNRINRKKVKRALIHIATEIDLKMMEKAMGKRRDDGEW